MESSKLLSLSWVRNKTFKVLWNCFDVSFVSVNVGICDAEYLNSFKDIAPLLSKSAVSNCYVEYTQTVPKNHINNLFIDK